MNIKQMAINEVIPYGKNPRKNDKAVEKVANSIREFGFQQPIVVDKDNVIICGHTRLKAAKKLKLKTIPVVVAEKLTPEQAKAYRIADNKTNEFAEWDNDLLTAELMELNDLDIDMDVLGFDVEDLKELMYGSDYSTSNSEIDIDGLDDDMVLTLKFTEQDYLTVKNWLAAKADTPEKAILKVIKDEQS
jgi:ParB-like chromosome segregation protein Spo0J